MGAITEFLEKDHRRLDALLAAAEPLDSEAALAAQAAEFAARMKAQPRLPLRPYSKRPEALEAAQRAMERAGFRWESCA